MRAAIVVGMTGIPLAMLMGRVARRYVTSVGIEQRLVELQGQLQAWQVAHDHQVDNIDRRLSHVEGCAARAETEARMLSGQLSEFTTVLNARLKQIEHRVARGQPPSATSGTCAVGSAGLRSRHVVDAGAEW